MAGIFKAVHNLGQLVAIKVLPPSKAKDAQQFARFMREGRLATRLGHPNVVRTFQVGECEGLYYLVMEYLEGETLAEVLKRRKRLPPVEAARLLHQALLGLQYIHEQDMIHRDLEPANLMLTPPRELGAPDDTLHATVKILDIGLGRSLFDEDADPNAPNLTTDGALLGNPDYVAPEQARDAHNVDIRADLYSMGCILYHALAGQPPFPDANPVRKMIRHATEKPAPLSSLNRDVNPGLEQLVEWMMAKDPGMRCPTPRQAAEGLVPFLPGAGRTPEPVGPEPHLPAYLEWLGSEGSVLDLELVPAGNLAVPVIKPGPSAPSRPTPPPTREPIAPSRIAPVDVEPVALHPMPLAEVPAPTGEPSPGDPPGGGLLSLTPRDYLLLCVGGGGVLLIVTLVVLIARWLGK
jgi:serine/threonine protein kinase